MLDPPHSAASPMVPALIGSGSPSVGSGVLLGQRRERVNLGDLFEFAEIFLAVAGEPARHAAIGQELGDIAARHRQMQIVDAIGFLDRFDLGLQRRQLPLHARDLLARRGRGRRALALLGCSQLIVRGRRAKGAANMIGKLFCPIIRSAASICRTADICRKMSNTLIEQGVSFSISAASALMPSSRRKRRMTDSTCR